MKIKLGLLILAGFACGASYADTINGVTMDFVTIGNPGVTTEDTGALIGNGVVNYSYRIGVNEVTYDQYNASGLATGGENPWGPNGPAGNVSWHKAAQYSNWLTSGTLTNGAYTISGGLVIATDRSAALLAYSTVYVLPTANEFQKAAYYDSVNDQFTTYANGTSTAPIAGSDANYNAVAAWDVATGTIEQNGTYDMMGNALEWLESLPADNDANERATAGGAYSQATQNIKNAGSRTGYDMIVTDQAIGFRVVSIPEPGTMSLMGMSTLGLFFARSRRRKKFIGSSVLPVRYEHFCDAYCSQEEWEAAQDVYIEEPAKLHLIAERGWEVLRPTFVWIGTNYNQLDRKFWDGMVVRHEKNVVQHKAFRTNLKKKSLDSFDAFLALFMK